MSYKEIRITIKTDDYDRIKTAAQNRDLSMAAFVRSLVDATIDDVRKRPSVDSKQLGELIYQLKKIGSNINQIAKKLNSGDNDVSERFMLQQLLIIQRTLKAVIHDCQN